MIKDEYRIETNKDVYAESNGKRGLEEHSTGDYSNDYVKWLETKLKNNEVLDHVSDCVFSNIDDDGFTLSIHKTEEGAKMDRDKRRDKGEDLESYQVILFE